VAETLFPGIDGIPFRTNGTAPPNLKNDDPQAKQPILVQDAKVRIFDLADKEQLLAYEQVWFKIGRQVYKFSAEERQFLPDVKNWRILLRYSELYLEMPKD
jgi:hypothetical protein